MTDEIIDLCGNVKITVDIPKGTKFDQKPISNSLVGAEVRKMFPYTGWTARSKYHETRPDDGAIVAVQRKRGRIG